MTPVSSAASIVLGAALLVWPAWVNGYPLVFSDTGAFLHQTLGPLMIWDKPWIYGPLLHVVHWRSTLWLPLAGQALLISHLLWLTARCCGRARPIRHVVLCALLATTTTLPFSAALLMPDILAPAVALALALLGFAETTLSRPERLWLGTLATFGIAAHLAHLPVAGALVIVVLVLRRAWRPFLRVVAPLAGAVALLLATNLAGHGRLALSPYGATFLLARLVADGPAARTIAAECPDRGWYLCDWAGRLPDNSDVFLWAPDSPVNRAADGSPRFLGGAQLAAEARDIIAETLRREPLTVAAQGVWNGGRQLVTAAAGDTLGPQYLDATVGRMLALGFPAAEQQRFAASLQRNGALAGLAAPLAGLHAAVLAVGVAGIALAMLRPAFGVPLCRPLVGLIVAVLVAVVANALTTGALSGVNGRYQARIAWLLPMLAILAWLPAATPADTRHAKGPRPDGRGP